MDKTETASNASDSPNSNLSSLSGLTGFEDEFYSIKSLIHSKEQSFIGNPLNRQHANDQNGFTKLNVDLHKVLVVSEKYKDDLSNLERKIELANHKKFDKLLKHNLKLENELSACKQRVLDLMCTGSEVTKQHKLVENELAQKTSDIQHCKNQIDHLELLNNELKIKYDEVKFDLDTKTTSISALKTKIVDLHVNIQKLNLSNAKLSNDLHITHNNFNSVKKSELWYKEQLHLSRSQKSALSQELAQVRSNLIEKEHALNTRTNECHQLNSLLKEIRSHKPEKVHLPESAITTASEHTVNSLQMELLALKSAIDAEKSATQQVLDENEILHKQNCNFTEIIKHKDSLIANLDNDHKDLIDKIENLETKVKDASELHQKTVSETCKMEQALEEAQRDKAAVECAITSIKNDFARFVERYNITKAEVFVANQCSKRLGEEKADLEKTNEKLLRDIADLSAKLKNVENRNRIQQEQLAAAQRENEAKTKDESHRINTIKELDRKLDQIRCDNKALHVENERLKDFETRHKDVHRSLRLKMRRLESRLKTLQQQILHDENEISRLKLINTAMGDGSTSIMNLRALCSAKDLEIKEKREKYHNNYRTLLRKVKEHIRGRNAAEKRCQQLQDLNNSIFEELSSCKVQSVSNTVEVDDLRSECRYLKDSDANSNGVITQLEKELCQKETDLVSCQNTIAKLNDEIVVCKNALIEQSEINEHLKADVNKKEVEINRLKEANDEVQRLIQHTGDMQRDLELEQRRCVESTSQLEEARRMWQQAEMQKDILVEDSRNLSAELEFKTKELAEIVQQKNRLHSSMQGLQSDLDALKSDKYFLQRLCNDLKFALTTTRNHSDILKRHVEALSLEYSSLPNFLDVPSPIQFDEAYISELLQQNVGFLKEQPLGNLQASLNLLKNEMTSLRQQVVGNIRLNFKVD